MSETLQISLTFPLGIYSGAAVGTAEELPSHARVHEAFVAAAAGGPWAAAREHVLVAREEHRRAIEWLEENEPLGMLAPRAMSVQRRARRYRWRASPVTPADTDFEPFSALDGPVVFLWPSPPAEVTSALATIAQEVTHVGRADSVVIARVRTGPEPDDGPRTLRIAPGRGPGQVMPVPARGRFAALELAHRHATRPGTHGAGSRGKQAPDEQVTGGNEAALELRRFASQATVDWPYAEVWVLPVAADTELLATLAAPENRVPAAVGIHRGLVRAIGTDVPSFVTGRNEHGDPLRGAGHLAVHVSERESEPGLDALLALPAGMAGADRRRLSDAIAGGLRVGFRTRRKRLRWFSLGAPEVKRPVPFWSETSRVQRTEVPLVLEATGGPKRGRWTLDDAVTCSLGYAMRGVLERGGLAWGTGWAFRRELVDHLRAYEITVRASRVHRPASRFVHRASPGDLVIAVDAAVDLGALAPAGGGFLALGRARHLGGGLLRPVVGAER